MPSSNSFYLGYSALLHFFHSANSSKLSTIYKNIYYHASCIWPGALPEKKQIVLSELFSKFMLKMISVRLLAVSFPPFMF